MDNLTLGVLSHSRKENERRLPIHPLHLDRIDADLRGRIYLEHGYGEHLGVGDDQLAAQVAGLRTRSEIVAACDVVLDLKPSAQDVAELRENQVLWGWPHCVQDRALTQAAVDGRLTVLAFEAMNHWTADGAFSLHVFHKNNELAGYCSVLHAMALTGSTGAYGRRLRAAVIGFGATARGAVTALAAHGVHDLDVLTGRDATAIASPIHAARILRLETDATDPHRNHVVGEEGRVPLAGFLAGYDIVVNCLLQNPDAPITYLTDDDLAAFAPESVIIDVSCDQGMGFSWAKPTSFGDPMVTIGDDVHYYAVDHSPSYLWNSTTWEISEALLPFLRTVLDGPDAWEADDTIRRAIEIRDGAIRNPAILSFQRRVPTYPHSVSTDHHPEEVRRLTSGT